MKRKQLLKTKRSDGGGGGVDAEQFNSLDDILLPTTKKTPMQRSGGDGGTSSTRTEKPSSSPPQADSNTPSPSTSFEEKRDIMKPQIQNICGDCHSTCSTCASSGAESECLACQQGLTFIAHHAATRKNNTNATSSNSTTGVCVSPISQANQSVIHTFNAHLIWISVGVLAILALLVAIIVALVRLPKRSSSTKHHASKLRDSYTYDRVDDSALLSDYDDQVLDDAFLSYKELKSKFNDDPDDDDAGEVEEGVDHRLPRDLTRVV